MRGHYASRGTLTRGSATVSKVTQKKKKRGGGRAFLPPGEVNKASKELGVGKWEGRITQPISVFCREVKFPPKFQEWWMRRGCRPAQAEGGPKFRGLVEGEQLN